MHHDRTAGSIVILFIFNNFQMLYLLHTCPPFKLQIVFNKFLFHINVMTGHRFLLLNLKFLCVGLLQSDPIYCCWTSKSIYPSIYLSIYLPIYIFMNLCGTSVEIKNQKRFNLNIFRHYKKSRKLFSLISIHRRKVLLYVLASNSEHN